MGVLFAAHPYAFYGQDFVHPGGVVTEADIDRIQFLLNIEGDPTIKSAYNKLRTNGHASYNYGAYATSSIIRGGGSGENYGTAMNQVAAAFQNALMWRISGDTRHADCAVRILNEWAKVCRSIGGDTNASLASGIYGYEFAQAGELLRGYEGWAEADFKAYQDWMRNLWYPRAMYFLNGRHGTVAGHYWSNWGLCNVLAVMSIGILCDDVAIYNQGLSYYKDDKIGTFTDEPRDPVQSLGYNEFLGNLVVWLHSDSRGPLGYLGQMQESGRDQGHSLMAAGLAADICQTAWNQGDDLYAYMNNRIAAGFEYVALVNSLTSSDLVNDSVPFHNYQKLGAEAGIKTQNGLNGWGANRPYWDRIVAHYEGEKGIKMHYSRKMKAKGGIDGGGGHYGTTSGGFDHLGFSTLTNYRPESWYPVAGNYPVTLTPSITYNGKTIEDNRISGVEKGSTVILTPSLPADVADDGSWKWETGETGRELTFTAQSSGIYRVTYTSAKGIRSTQAFNVAVWGDCTPDIVTPQITVGETTYQDTVITVLPYQKFSLSIYTAMYNRGSASWSTGSSGLSTTVANGVRTDSIIWVDHYNEGGYRTRINFHIKLRYVTPSISIEGGNAVSSGNVSIEPGQSVELKPVTTAGFDGGTFRWSSGHTSKSLMVLNIQKPKKLQLYYTLTKNNVTTIDTLDFRISVAQRTFQLAPGDYYIQDAANNSWLTNTNQTATTKVKPSFEEKDESEGLSQVWTISKETAADAGGRFKIVSARDGNYVNEKGNFGTNPYYSSWNTYTLHCLQGEDLFAIQNGGSAGTKYWSISNGGVVEGSESQNGYPFRITPVIPQKEDTTTIPGADLLSYIAPAYSVGGGASQRGSQINATPGKSLRLRPITVSGLSGGSWLWDDGSTASTLDLGVIEKGGVYTVNFSYPEEDTTYVFPLIYTVTLAEDNYLLPEGTYHILRGADNHYLTNNGTLIPKFAAEADGTPGQRWIVTLDPVTSRHKIVSAKDGRHVGEHGAFNTSAYNAARNSYLFHYTDSGEKFFAIQNGGSGGTTYWAIEGDVINDAGQTARNYPFKFVWISSSVTSISEVNLAQIDIYPNPVEDYLIVNIPESMNGKALFSLYRTDGQTVRSIGCDGGENRIDTSDIPAGLYFGTLKTENGSRSFKIVKK